MEIFEAINTRRSIRKFSDKPVSDQMIRKALEAAMMAPSAGNAQPWRFIVVTESDALKATAGIHPHLGMAKQAQAGILVCTDLSLEKFPGYWVQDCSAAMQNLLLGLHAQGLGAVWTGVYPMADRVTAFKEMFNLPEQVIPLGFVPVGWPDQAPKSESRFKEDRVHYNTF